MLYVDNAAERNGFGKKNLKTLQKFPGWSDTEVAEFVRVTVEYVQQRRRELAKSK